MVQSGNEQTGHMLSAIKSWVADAGTQCHVRAASLSPKCNNHNIIRCLVNVQNKLPHALWKAADD